MRSAAWAVISVVVAAFAGCFSDAPLAPNVAEGSVDEFPAPTWKVGDWWTYAFSSDYYDVGFGVTLVVVETGTNGTIVGIPVDQWTVLPIVYHVPPTGRVNANLSFDVHGFLFEPFAFPLVQDKQWETRWAAVPIALRANVTDVGLPNGSSVRGVVVSNHDLTPEALANQQRRYEAAYAREVGWFVRSERALADGRVLERFELVAWGHGHEGPVRAIDNTTLLYVDSRTPPNPLNGDFLFLQGTEFALDSFASTGTQARVALALEAGQAPGRYRVQMTSPSGATNPSFDYTAAPGDTKLHGIFLEAANEQGSWSVRFAPLGTGFVIADATGFDSWDVELPFPVVTAGEPLGSPRRGGALGSSSAAG